ncbi:MAG: YchJ family metal-binding protein [Myxococcota bacterium]
MRRRKNAHRAKPCPCGSGRIYRECCGVYHGGEPAPDAVALMRSRYSAYALGLSDYIIGTTLPGGDSWHEDESGWKRGLRAFAREFFFAGVEILESQLGETRATVTFRAVLRKGAADRSFTERSEFVLVDGRWVYARGDTQDPG